MHHLMSRAADSAWRRAASLVVALLLLQTAPVSIADESGEQAQPLPPGTQTCVNITRIRSTRIIDDSTILFYMQGGKVYVNHLPRRCPGLKIAGAFSYKTSVSSLCDVDIITVIRPTSAVVRGPSCGLGVFQPITAEEIELLRAEPQPDTESEEVVPEIEPPASAEAPEKSDATAESAIRDRNGSD